MKKVLSSLLLAVLAFLVIGNFVPDVYADETLPTTVDVNVTFTFNSEDTIQVQMEDKVYGSELTIDFDGVPANNEFAYWIVNGFVRKDLEQATKFIAINDLELVAVFYPTNPLKHAVVFMDSNRALVDRVVYVADEAPVIAPVSNLPDKPGYVLVDGAERWISIEGSESLSSITSNSVFLLQYQLDINTKFDINVTDGDGGGEYVYNEIVTVSSGLPNFTHWEENGQVVSYDAEYKFSALYNRDLVAKTGGTETPIVTLVELELRSGLNSYLGQVSLPDGYTLIEYGLVVDGVRRNSNTLQPATNEFLVTMTNSISSIESYMIIKNESNELSIVDGDVVLIYDESGLRTLLAGQVDPEALSKTYKLKNDIVLTSNWTAIGIAPNEDEGVVGVPFTGVFDGQGYKISGISMPGGGWNKGFFGYIGTTGVVKNTHFEGFLEANAWSGALAANNSGTIQDVVVDIEVYVWGANGGAIVEHNHGLLKNIIVLGKAVSDNGPTAVGLVVTNFGTLENVFANVDTVGTPNLVSFGGVVDDGTYIISAESFVAAATYANFSSDVWTIVDGSAPVLKQA